MSFKTPSRLKAGDRVAIVSPSAGLPALYPWVYEQGLRRILEVFEVEPVEFPTARQNPPYLAENPKARAEDVNAAFRDESIKAVIATVGGNDQIRILPYLDRETISSNPKIFLGYSDCTNLHLYLWNLGMVSYYGGMVMTQFAMQGGMHPYTVKYLKRALFEEAIGKVEEAPYWTDADLQWADPKNLEKQRPLYKSERWHWESCDGKVVQGRLWGGCLETIDLHLGAKKYLPSLEQLTDTVLYVETSEEMPSEGFVYRTLSALAESGILNGVQALLVGHPKGQFCGQEAPGGRAAYFTSQREAIMSSLGDYGHTFPVVFGLPFGHTDPQFAIPSGAIATVDGGRRTVTFQTG